MREVVVRSTLDQCQRVFASQWIHVTNQTQHLLAYWSSSKVQILLTIINIFKIPAPFSYPLQSFGPSSIGKRIHLPFLFRTGNLHGLNGNATTKPIHKIAKKIHVHRSQHSVVQLVIGNIYTWPRCTQFVPAHDLN